MNEKDYLRKRFLTLRDTFKSNEVIRISKEIEERFFILDIVRKSSKFLLYHSFRKEIITHDIIKLLLKDGKQVFLPYVDRESNELKIGEIHCLKELTTGVFGIKEPLKKDNIPIFKMDIIVVPGLLFAMDGFRLGYGGGYYDRMLSGVSGEITKIGLAYDSFIKDILPVENFDIPVDIIISENRTIYIEDSQK